MQRLWGGAVSHGGGGTAGQPGSRVEPGGREAADKMKVGEVGGGQAVRGSGY